MNNQTNSSTYTHFFDLALKMQSLLLKENQPKEDTMVQYLELVLKRDFASGWRRTIEKVRVFFEKASEVGPKEKAEEADWKERAGKNWYY
jgi:hypothetical protein